MNVVMVDAAGVERDWMTRWDQDREDRVRLFEYFATSSESARTREGGNGDKLGLQWFDPFAGRNVNG